MIVNTHEAKSRLSELIARAERGEDVLIARNGRPVVRLVPAAAPEARPGFGALKAKLPPLDDDVFAPWSEEELRAMGLG